MDVQATTAHRMSRQLEDPSRCDSVTTGCVNKSASSYNARAATQRHKCLGDFFDGRSHSAEPRRLLLSSAQTAWSGFPLEKSSCYDCGGGSLVFPHAEVILLVVGRICVNYRAFGRDEYFCAREGTVTLWPAGSELNPFAWTARHEEISRTELLRVQLDMSALERLAPEDDPLTGIRLTVQTAVEDAALVSLMHLMEVEIASGCPAGRLYGESLSLALAAHVATHYSNGSTEAQRSGLSRPVLLRVLEHIYANLGRELTIIELAAVANMSAHHFSLCFKRSVGVTPHQWVVRARIREAARLLRNQRMPVAEVALALGFASQTHFTDVFRRVTGTTPHHYRRRC